MRMRAVITYVGLTTAVVMSGTAQAQVSKTMNGEAKVVTATVEAIERQSRQITLKNTDGTYEILDVPASAKRFDGLKVGDTVKARYYERSSSA